MRYRRANVPGGQYFFTLVTAQRRSIFADGHAVDLLRQSFREVASKRPFSIDAVVILPDHFHCIWTLPPDDAEFATRWRLVNTWFTKHCDERLRTAPDDLRLRRGDKPIWQHRYWEHLIRDDMDLKNHVDYIHYNPVKHGLVTRPCDWPYSSIHRYIRQGLLTKNWGVTKPDLPEEVGNE